MQIGEGATSKVLKFSYDASGNAVAVDYSTDSGSSFTTYYYVRNAQNDVVKLIDSSGNTVFSSTAKKTANHIVFSSDALDISKTYTLYLNGSAVASSSVSGTKCSI